jgi:hypothetical protein
VAGREQFDSAATPLEQQDAQLALQGADRHAQRLLRQPQPHGRPGHAPFLDDRGEVGEFAQVELHLPLPDRQRKVRVGNYPRPVGMRESAPQHPNGESPEECRSPFLTRTSERHRGEHVDLDLAEANRAELTRCRAA